MTIISLGKQYVYMIVRTKCMCISHLAPGGVCAYLVINTHGNYVFLMLFDTFHGYKQDATPLYSQDFYYLPDTMKKLLTPYLRPYKNRLSKEYRRFLCEPI